MAKKIEINRWWEGMQPIHEEGDGQEFRLIYARCNFGSWEYAIVTTGDDGTFHKALLPTKGKIVEITGR